MGKEEEASTGTSTFSGLEYHFTVLIIVKGMYDIFGFDSI